MSKRVSVSMPDKMVQAIDSVCDKYSLARSRVIRDLLGKVIEDGELSEAVVDAIPESTLKLAELEAKEAAMMDKQKILEKRASHADRVKGYLSKRLEGHAAYKPEDQRLLAEGYKEDARIWHDDADEIAEKEAEVDKWMDWYEMGYWARKICESTESEVNTDDISAKWFEVGQDLFKLRANLEDVVDQINRVANSEGVGYDHKAVVTAIARKNSVCYGAALLLIQHMVTDPEDTIRTALTYGGDRLAESAGMLNGLTPTAALPDSKPETATVQPGMRAYDDECERAKIAVDGVPADLPPQQVEQWIVQNRSETNGHAEHK